MTLTVVPFPAGGDSAGGGGDPGLRDPAQTVGGRIVELVDLARELEGGDHGRRPVAWVNGARRQLRVSEAE